MRPSRGLPPRVAGRERGLRAGQRAQPPASAAAAWAAASGANESRPRPRGLACACPRSGAVHGAEARCVPNAFAPPAAPPRPCTPAPCTPAPGLRAICAHTTIYGAGGAEQGGQCRPCQGPKFPKLPRVRTCPGAWHSWGPVAVHTTPAAAGPAPNSPLSRRAALTTPCLLPHPAAARKPARAGGAAARPCPCVAATRRTSHAAPALPMSSHTGCLRPSLPEASQVGRCRAAGAHASRQTGYHTVCAPHDPRRWVVSVRAAVAQLQTSSAPVSTREPPMTVSPATRQAYSTFTLHSMHAVGVLPHEQSEQAGCPCACSSSSAAAGKFCRTVACTPSTADCKQAQYARAGAPVSGDSSAAAPARPACPQLRAAAGLPNANCASLHLSQLFQQHARSSQQALAMAARPTR